VSPTLNSGISARNWPASTLLVMTLLMVVFLHPHSAFNLHPQPIKHQFF
jgi:hypothetical protein